MLVVTAALVGWGGLVAEAGDAEVDWVTADGEWQQLPLDLAAGVGFEDGLPVRRFAVRKGQRHLSGRWWCATTGGHVGFESWLERDHLMLLDFDPMVVGIASQPFRLGWTDASGSRVWHVPDYFARRVDGSVLVVDCRPIERRRPEDLVKFAVTGRACARLGWEHRLVAGLDPVLVGNLRWLAGYRHPRHDIGPVVSRLRVMFTEARGLMDGAAAVGDPIAVLPVLFHLLWRQELSVDLCVPLHSQALVAIRVLG